MIPGWIKKGFGAVLLMTFFVAAHAQNDEFSFSSNKLSIINYGERLQTGIASPCTVHFNLRDSLITFSCNEGEVGRFLEGQNEFKIQGTLGVEGTSVQAFLVDNDFVVAINYLFNSVFVSKRRMNVRMHSLEFREIIRD